MLTKLEKIKLQLTNTLRSFHATPLKVAKWGAVAGGRLMWWWVSCGAQHLMNFIDAIY